MFRGLLPAPVGELGILIGCVGLVVGKVDDMFRCLEAEAYNTRWNMCGSGLWILCVGVWSMKRRRTGQGWTAVTRWPVMLVTVGFLASVGSFV